VTMISSLKISPNMYAQLVDANDSGYVSDDPADDNGDVVIDVPPGTYALSQGPTATGPWSAVANIPTMVVANASDAAGDLTPAGAVFPGSGSGAQAAVAWLSGNGVPNNALGQNGWFYARGDGAAGSFLYHKAAGVWTAIL
jgi:hypothetical protein